MQVYKGMDIGTAKITPKEMDGVPHHLLNIKEPNEPFSVAEFQSVVRKKIADIHQRGAIPFIVGGTGLYIQSVLYDYQFSKEKAVSEIRAQLEKRAEQGEGRALYKKLKEVDPQSAANIHPNNERRVIRALQYYIETGKRLSDKPPAQQSDLLYDTALVGLTMDRKKLYNRINERVDQMIENGLLDEAKLFYDRGIRNVQSVQAIGYKELYEYFKGNLTLDESIALLKKNTRRFAKRQFTWFQNKMNVEWFDMTNEGEYLKKIDKIIRFIAGKLQIKANT